MKAKEDKNAENNIKKPILSNRLFCVFAIWITWSSIAKIALRLVTADIVRFLIFAE